MRFTSNAKAFFMSVFLLVQEALDALLGCLFKFFRIKLHLRNLRVSRKYLVQFDAVQLQRFLQLFLVHSLREGVFIVRINQRYQL